MERLISLPNGTTLCVDERGPADGPLMLQLEGHMAQWVSIPESYLDALAALGCRVVALDNRDVGRSQRFPGADYSVAAMADDVHHLIGELGGPAVLCGRSMGGAIAQLVAQTHPADVLGLGLFFTFAKAVRDPAPLAIRPAPFTGAASYVAWRRADLPAIAGSAHPVDPEEVDRLSRLQWERGVDWAGFERQRRAMAFQQPWAGGLGPLVERGLPVAILHGVEDRVVPVERAHHLARLLPQASVHLIDGLGHQQPTELDDVYLRATLEAAGR